MVFSLWNELIIRALSKMHYSASYYSLLAFVIRYTSTQEFHNWNRRAVARVAQWVCKFKLSKWQIAHKDKYRTKTAHVSSSICQCCSPISLAFFCSSAQLTVRTRCLRHLQVKRAEAAIVVQHIHTDRHTSCSIQCIISLPFCSEWNVWEHKWKDIWYMHLHSTAATRATAAAAQALPTHSSGIIIN